MTQAIREITWIILGGGAVVQEYYLPAFKALNLLEKVIIIEPSAKVIRQITKFYSVNCIQEDYQLFFEKKTDFSNCYCIITVPNFLHLDAIRKCVDRSIPILCEKPLTIHEAEGNEIVELQQMSKVPISVAQVRRLMPSIKILKQILENQEIGDVESIDIQDGNVFSWVADSYSFFDPKNGGVLADMGVHYLDLLTYLFGNYSLVSSSDDFQGGVEANCELTLITQTGIPISLKLSRTQILKNAINIKGTKANAIVKKDNFSTCFIIKNGLTHAIQPEIPFQSGNWLLSYESCFIEQIYLFHEAIQRDIKFVPVEDVMPATIIIDKVYSNRSSTNLLNENSEYLITGASGFIGSALVERLYNKGGNITALMRSYKNCAEIGKFGISMPRVDLLNYEEVAQQMKGKKHVIHLAYATDGLNSFQINVEGTKNIVRAAHLAGVESIVVLSTMFVYGQSQKEVNIDESSPYNPYGGDYGKSKKQMQAWCLKWAKKNPKTRLVLLNPSCVYGPKGKTFTTLPLVLAKSNRFAWVENGSGIANYVYIDNLIDAIELALTNVAASGKNFIINDGICTWKQFIDPILCGYSNNIPSYTNSEIINGKFKKESNAKEIFKFLISNYELMDLINRHKLFGAIKRIAFKFLPSFKKMLNNERILEPLNLQNLQNVDYNPPVWLSEIFGINKSKFSSQNAKLFLGWEAKVKLEEGQARTIEWLKNTNQA